MMLFIFVPSLRVPGTTTIDASWSLNETPDAMALAAKRVQELRAAGIEAHVHPHGGSFITPSGSRMAH
jgi:hypothetical protein